MKGYAPVVRVNGRPKSARRAIYEVLVRELLSTEKLRMGCGFSVCVNPSHCEVYEYGYEQSPPEIEETEPEDVMTAEELADIILDLTSRDPQELAHELCLPIEQIRAALELV